METDPDCICATSTPAESRSSSPCHGKSREMTRRDNPSGAIHAMVVDDEAMARRNLVVLLRADADIASVTDCESGADAVEEIRNRKPDLVFLDVQMPECGGFDVLEMLGNQVPIIIFV